MSALESQQPVVVQGGEYMPPVNLNSAGPVHHETHMPGNKTGFGQKHGEYAVHHAVELVEPIFSE